jgi:hypothetical protein
MMRIYPSVGSCRYSASLFGGPNGRHFDQQAIQRAAVIVKIAAHYSRDERWGG